MRNHALGVSLASATSRREEVGKDPAEEMLAMGADLREAKRVCREDGKLFTAWCESAECPVGYKTAQQLIAVHAELGGKKELNLLFSHSFDVLARVTQTREEDMRQALLEHIEKEAEDGNKVTQKEITAELLLLEFWKVC